MDQMNVKITLSYDGTDYCGFQLQTGVRTIEEELEKGLLKITKVPTKLNCAGRTDSGVHAEAQVINFFTSIKSMNENNWIQAFNSVLPKDIRINACEFQDNDFHARRSSIYREYWYNITNSSTISALLYRFSAQFYFFKLDENLLRLYGNEICGEHDFTSFCSANDVSLSKSRFIHSIKVERTGDQIVIKIIANAFLQHMIRIIVGTMLKLHKENKPPEDMKRILLAKDRQDAGTTFVPKGLVFKKVYYDESVLKKIYSYERKNYYKTN